MSITSITYSRTRNLGNYESARIEATIEVEYVIGGAHLTAADDSFVHLKAWVLRQLGQEQKVANGKLDM